MLNSLTGTVASVLHGQHDSASHKASPQACATIMPKFISNSIS